MLNKAWLDRISYYWWSQLPGRAYTSNGKGTGKLANDNPGAFNLYAVLSCLPTPSSPGFADHQQKTLGQLVELQQWSTQEMHGYPLSEWAIVYNQKEFVQWMTLNQTEFKKLAPPRGYPTMTCFCNRLKNSLQHVN